MTDTTTTHVHTMGKVAEGEVLTVRGPDGLMVLMLHVDARLMTPKIEGLIALLADEVHREAETRAAPVRVLTLEKRSG